MLHYKTQMKGLGLTLRKTYIGAKYIYSLEYNEITDYLAKKRERIINAKHKFCINHSRIHLKLLYAGANTGSRHPARRTP